MENSNSISIDVHAQPQTCKAETSIDEVVDTTSKLKDNKASGSDNIPAKLLVHGGNALTIEVHELITEIRNKNLLPDEWKLGIIIHKKEDKLKCIKTINE